jgi:hypothetical protein
VATDHLIAPSNFSNSSFPFVKVFSAGFMARGSRPDLPNDSYAFCASARHYHASNKANFQIVFAGHAELPD